MPAAPQGPPPPPAPPPPWAAGGVRHEEDLITRLVPSKNLSAVLAYYFGVFSAVPLVGCVLGIPAVVLGFLGLDRAAKLREAKGGAHAWAGVMLGLLFGFGQIVALIYFLTHPGSFDRFMDGLLNRVG